MTSDASRTNDVLSNDKNGRVSESSTIVLPYYNKEVNVLHESIQKAIDLIQHYGDQQDDGKTSKITQPKEIYNQLDNARNDITNAWQHLYDAFYSNSDNDTTNNESKVNATLLTEKDQIRIAYLNMITDSFGNVLENLHTKNSNTTDDEQQMILDVDVLADCLQSGYDMLSLLNDSTGSNEQKWYEEDFLWNDNYNIDDDEDNDNNSSSNDDDNKTIETITPHERHRRELGFNVM